MSKLLYSMTRPTMAGIVAVPKEESRRSIAWGFARVLGRPAIGFFGGSLARLLFYSRVLSVN
jgi:hypothetical protein